jgi:hypothetical protein
MLPVRINFALLLVVLLSSCAPRRPRVESSISQAKLEPKAVAKAASIPPGVSKGAYLPLFEDLLAKVKRYHVFAAGQEAVFDRALPTLRKAAAEASTESEGMVALARLQRALGDRHCNLSPPGDVRPARLGLGLELHTEREASGKVRVRVETIEDPALESKVAIGDELLLVDGVPAETWLAEHPFESNALNPVARLSETAHAIVMQLVPWTTTKEGDSRRLTFQNAGELDLRFRRPFRYERKERLPDIDDNPAMATIHCTGEAASPYSGYELATLGVNYCTYRPKPDNRAAQGTKIVRFVSFMYDAEPASQLRWVRVDHDGLSRDLAGAKRVVLDLHENHGGNNPFVFLSWFAKKPWRHESVTVRVFPEFGEEEVRRLLWGNDDLVKRYLEAGKRGEPSLTYPFLCSGEGCDGFRGPRPSERVSEAPVGVVTGPECTSSCDAFSVIWSEVGMGPIVGKQPMHGFTTVRHELPMRGPGGRTLGQFRIALSFEGFPGKPPLEGAPIRLDWQAPETFATRTSWLDASVSEVSARLTAR